jgi:uncharacterized protein YhhL (DUF1145 family)
MQQNCQRSGDVRLLDHLLYDAPSNADVILLITTGIMLLVERIYILVLITITYKKNCRMQWLW